MPPFGFGNVKSCVIHYFHQQVPVVVLFVCEFSGVVEAFGVTRVCEFSEIIEFCAHVKVVAVAVGYSDVKGHSVIVD